MDEGYMENGNMIVELVDEDGNDVRFEHIYTVEHEGEEYVLLVPIDDVEGIAEDEMVIMRIEPDEENDAYVGIEDEALLETIFEKYLELAEADEENDEAFEDE